jgi:hypothetical protein
MRAHNSGVTFEPCCSLALSAHYLCELQQFVSKGKTSAIMLEILGAIIQCEYQLLYNLSSTMLVAATSNI